jgi:hypothetical protein
VVISVEVTDYDYNVKKKIERGGAGGEEREKYLYEYFAYII